jgi:HlyD family secretion protein
MGCPEVDGDVREWTTFVGTIAGALRTFLFLSDLAVRPLGRMLAQRVVMDIARPEFKKQKFRRQVIIGAIAFVVLGAATYGVSRLKPAAPSVERSTIWTDTVKRGPMLRQVHGLGTLVPSQEFIRQIPAETEATVMRIRELPGSQVRADTILVEMSNPQVEQAALDARLQLRATEAALESMRVRLQSDLMNQKAAAATVSSDYTQAKLQADMNKELRNLGLTPEITYKNSQTKAEELSIRNSLEGERLDINRKAIDSQLAEQQARVDQMRALAGLKQRQLEALKVRAGIEGVLVDLPLQVGQHVLPGTMLAKVIQPNHLMATLKIAETQARDVQIGQPALVDTHNGTVAGAVVRVDPGVQNGTVSVDVKLAGELPKGARPDLSVDGTIDLERLEDVLYVGRPAFGQENSTIGLFKLDSDGKGAVRVPVKVGRASVNSIQVLEGLRERDVVILSDMSRWDNAERIRLD